MNNPESLKIEITTEDRLAQLAGFDNQIDKQGDNKSVPLLSDEELQEQISRHSFASSPLSKLIFVAGAMFVVVFIASLFFSQFQSSGNRISAKKVSKSLEKPNNPLLSQASADKEKADLLSELALREQREALTNNKLTRTQLAKSKATQVYTHNDLVNRDSPKVASTRALVNKTPTYPVIPRPAIVRHPLGALVAKGNDTDSPEAWKQLAMLGSFGSNTSIASPNNRAFQIPTPKPSAVEKTTKVVELPSSEDPQAILFGQSVSAILQNTISWEASYYNQNTKPDEQYLIALNQPLKDKYGKEQIPAGSKLVVRLDSKSGALVSLLAVNVLINGASIAIPEGALKIRSLDGQPLIAQLRTIGGNNEGASLGDLVSVAGSLANIPAATGLYGMNRLFPNNSYNFGSRSNIYFLPQGTAVQVFVNQGFSIHSIVRDPPLDLDLRSSLEAVP